MCRKRRDTDETTRAKTAPPFAAAVWKPKPKDVQIGTWGRDRKRQSVREMNVSRQLLLNGMPEGRETHHSLAVDDTSVWQPGAQGRPRASTSRLWLTHSPPLNTNSALGTTLQHLQIQR
ncbi:hypothetical protein Q8A67_016452 [Cirrhinus molitorella]|uniref:Uncharacterized protein n=1 Tax=Cirrhinus molitorella TaxID=172907 RepID=A0AA88TGH8_9TELE|nr:hypothetical protein Q8A67_016452 [Cirrhinus molitorella]